MKDSQPAGYVYNVDSKYIKVNNERFSTVGNVQMPDT